MKLTAVAALGVYLVWQAINSGIQIVGMGSEEIDLLDLVKHGLSPSLAAASLFLLVVVVALRWGREVGLAQGPQRGTPKVIWPWLLFLALFALSALNAGLPPASVTLFIFANTMLVGWSEEVMFRGIWLRGLFNSFGIWVAILGSSLIFGVIHVLNVFLTGDLRGAFLQAGAAFLSGVFLAAIRLRTGSLWTGIVLHGLWDAGTFLVAAGATATHEATAAAAPTALGDYGSIVMSLPLFLLGLFFLRHAGRDYGKDFA
ncbi:MAG: CPBP family intramembrane metalloprotease [Rhodobacteraceae bacterium]|nr:CPBP family intramembrane metalloprotease [Paracoccaceae bacterium]